jgi:DNA-binding XRE family transcriptional regulator
MMDEKSTEPLTFESLRKSAGYSQAKLGKQIGVSQSAVKLWESGQCEPSISNVIALAKALKVSIKTVCSSMGIDVAEVPNDN